MTHEKYGDYRDIVEKEVHEELAEYGLRLVHEEDGEPLEHGHMMVIFGWMQKSYGSTKLDKFLSDLCQVCDEQGIQALNLAGEPIELDNMKAQVIVGAVGTAYWRGAHLKKKAENG